MSYDQQYRFTGNFLELIKILYNNPNSIDEKLLPLILETFNIETALGTDLDRLGNFVGVSRDFQETDEDYRAKISSYMGGYDLQPTQAGLEFLADELVGVRPTIYEYPTIDFTDIFGRSHPGIMMSFTVDQVNSLSEEIGAFRRFALNYKAAGVPMLIGTFHQLLEQYLEAITDTYLQGRLYNFPEITNIIYPEGTWDITNWDESTWDHEVHFSDQEFLGRPESRFIENYLETLMDTLLQNLKYFFTETYSESLDDSDRAIGIGLFDHAFGGWDKTTWDDFGRWDQEVLELLDTIDFDGIIKETETVIAGDLMMQIYYTGNLQILEQYLIALSEPIAFDGTLFIEVEHGKWDYGKWDEDYWDMGWLDTLLANVKPTLPDQLVSNITELAYKMIADMNYDEDYIGSLIDTELLNGLLQHSDSVSDLTDTYLLNGSIKESENPFSGTTSPTLHLITSHWDVGVSTVGYGKVGSAKVGYEDGGGKWDIAKWDDDSLIHHVMEDYV